MSWSNPLDTLILQYSSTPNRMGGAMLELVGHWTGPRKYASREGQFQYQLVYLYWYHERRSKHGAREDNKAIVEKIYILN